MANKQCNVAYDQIPNIVINHTETNPDHWAIMICLFKVLKDAPKPIVYSNTKLSENCRLPLRTVERRLPELCKMGFITCTGLGRSRRISIGLLFSITATVAVGDSPPANKNSPPAKSDRSARHTGGHNKHYTKPSSKADLSSSSTPKPTLHEIQNYAWHLANNENGIPDDLVWISDFLPS